jgi:hypothetical protein
LAQRGQHVLAWNRLHPGNDVRGILGIAVDHADRAAADKTLADAVPHRLLQARRQQHLGVVMRVDVDKARRHPQAVRIHHLVGIGTRQRRLADSHNLTVTHGNVGDTRRLTGTVEYLATLNKQIVKNWQNWNLRAVSAVATPV